MLGNSGTLPSRSGRILLMLLMGFLAIAPRSLAGNVGAAPFALSVSAPPKIPAGGPIPLQVSIAYKGDPEIEIGAPNGKWADVTFELPEGWIRRPTVTFHGTSGMASLRLRKNETIACTLYLHQFFSVVLPGKWDLSMTLTIWPNAGEARVPWVMVVSLPFEIEPDSEDALRARVAAIGARAQAAASEDERTDLYESALWVSHPSVIPVLIESLTSGETRISGKVRERLIELCEQTADWKPVINYLASCGGRYDEVFFQRWRTRGLLLSDQAHLRLAVGSNPWIRLYRLQYLESDPDKLRAGIASLARECAEMTLRIQSTGKPVEARSDRVGP